MRGHGERILYVDDEAPLVMLAVQFLERLGYRVDGYTSAEEALEAFRLQPDAYDAVVTDYNMPGLSGTDVALTVISLRPAMLVALGIRVPASGRGRARPRPRHPCHDPQAVHARGVGRGGAASDPRPAHLAPRRGAYNCGQRC